MLPNIDNGYNLSNSPAFETLLIYDHLNLSITSDNASNNVSQQEVYSNSDKVFWALLLLPLPLVAVFGNILVMLSVYKERNLQTVTNYFIVSLAFADLLVAAVVMPFAVYVLASQVNGDWELSETLCDFYIALDVTCSTASIFNLVAISVDRYIAVTQPIKYSKHKNSRRVLVTIAFVWLVSAAIGSPIVLGLNTSPERQPDLCVFYNSDFIIYSSLSSFYIPCTVMVYLYYKIFKAIHARARSRKLRAANSESGCRSSGSGSLTNDPATPKRHVTPPNTTGLQVVIDKDMLTMTNTGSNSQEDDFDEEGGPTRGAAAPAMLLSAFVAETVRIEIPLNGNADSGYGTSHMETTTTHPDFPGVEPRPKTKEDKRSRLNLGRRHKSSRKKREKASAKKEKKATKTLAIVLGMFLICWLPFFTCNILDAICIKLENDTWRPGVTIFLLTTWLGYINSCVNPVIYTIFNMEFRKAFKKIIKEYWLC